MKASTVLYAVAIVLVFAPAVSYSFLMRSGFVDQSLTAQILSAAVFVAGLVLVVASGRIKEKQG